MKLENYNFESRKNKFRVEITNFAERITNEEVFVQISFDNSEIKKCRILTVNLQFLFEIKRLNITLWFIIILY